MRRQTAVKDRRHGVAAVEFAVCLPLLCLVLTGLWEVGRIVQVSEVMWNSAREARVTPPSGRTTSKPSRRTFSPTSRAQSQRPSVKVTRPH